MSNLCQLIQNELNNNIKKFIKEKNLNPKQPDDLKSLLSLNINNKKFSYENLLDFLLQYLNKSNESIFCDHLLESCEKGKLNNIKILLENGININCQNNKGETPLHIAILKKDIELINILVRYEPDTNLSTYEDNLTVKNYAENSENKYIIKIINDLDEKNKKKIVKTEVINYINKGMDNIDNINYSNISFLVNENNNLNDIQNYNGEKISIITHEDESISSTLNYINKNSLKSGINLNNFENTSTINPTIVNESEFFEDNSPKNTIKNNNYNTKANVIAQNYLRYNDIHNKFFLEDCPNVPKQLTDLKCNSSPLKKRDEINYNINSSINPSVIQSLTTAHSLNKEQIESPLLNNKDTKTFSKKDQLFKFISEINLPEIYANYLLENGFDDLEVLILQAKDGLALTDQHLKEIGITLPGERAKILIHLEELAGNFPFNLESNIIYSNKSVENKDSSLYIFFSSLNLEEYISKFKNCGYNNVELLYIQMISKYPITEDFLKNDIGLNNTEHIKKIILNLKNRSENYIHKLYKKNIDDKNNRTIIYENSPYMKSCDACNII
jgi:hypothetical protein